MDDRTDEGPIHDGEIVVDEDIVRSVLSVDRPDLAGLDLSPLRSSGTDNTMWRIRRTAGPDLVVRLPRTDAAVGGLATELSLLGQLAHRRLPVLVPVLHHVGRPTERYPHPWAVLEWLDGVDAWAGRRDTGRDGDHLAVALAETVRAIGAIDGIDAPRRRPGRRGGPLRPLLDHLDRWLDDPAWSAPALIDVGAVRRVAAEAREVAGVAIEPSFVHGDLLPGNLLLRRSRLAAVIDWGAAAIADPAQDLAPAWSVLDARGRRVFRQAMGVDEATWTRGRAFELEHAVGAILYYRPRGHPLARIMTRTLERVLADAAGSGN